MCEADPPGPARFGEAGAASRGRVRGKRGRPPLSRDPGELWSAGAPRPRTDKPELATERPLAGTAPPLWGDPGIRRLPRSRGTLDPPPSPQPQDALDPAAPPEPRDPGPGSPRVSSADPPVLAGCSGGPIPATRRSRAAAGHGAQEMGTGLPLWRSRDPAAPPEPRDPGSWGRRALSARGPQEVAAGGEGRLPRTGLALRATTC